MQAVKIDELERAGLRYRLTRPHDDDPSSETLIDGVADVSGRQAPCAV